MTAASRALRSLRALLSRPFRDEIGLALGRRPAARDAYPALDRIPLGRRAVVVDAGAHVGRFTESVLARRPHARVFAFEPQARACGVLAGRMRPYANVTVEHLALGREPGRRALRVRAVEQASSFADNGAVLAQGLYGLDFSVAEEVPVEVTTLAAYAAAHGLAGIALLKLDVQGFELEVLAGAEAILPHVDWIYTEAHFQELYRGTPRYDDVFRHLHARGFELLQMAAFRADDAGRLLECDMLFRRRRAP